jgi:very-short-patch-repair endonuclease
MAAIDRKAESPEAILARIGTSAHGVASRQELLQAGLTRHQIATRLESGALITVHRGVYRVGHAAPSTEARYLAAVLACGDGAVLSGLAAAWLWGIVKGKPRQPEVTTWQDRQVPGVRCRRSRTLTHQDKTVRLGIPVASLPRTIVDLSHPLPAPDLARALHEAWIKHRATPPQVEATLARIPNSPGTAKLRAVLRGDQPVTLSTLEARFLSLLRANDLPLPHTNTRFGARRLDCRWPAHRLVVELDSYRYHGSRHAWEEDRRRERLVRAAGEEFRRYTWGDVLEAPALMLRELRTLLRR